MKKMTAMIAGCMIITGAFVSCGEDVESSSGKNAASAGTAEITSENASVTETVPETETSSESSSEASESTSASEAPSAENDEKAPAELIGNWRNIYSITDQILTFEEDGTFSNVTDYTPYLSINGSKAAYVGIEADVEYKDGDLKILSDGNILCEYSKFHDIDPEGIDGLYVEVNTPETLVTPADDGAYYRIEGGKTERIMDGKYSVDGDTLTITQIPPEGADIITEDYAFTLDYGRLNMTSKVGDEELVCEKAG